MALYRLVTVAEAKDQLSILDNEDDSRIDSMVRDASQDVMAYINQNLDGWTDTSGLPLVDGNGDPQRIGAIGTLDSNGELVLTLDSNGDPIDAGISVVPGPVRRATLVLIARMDDDREGKEEPFNETVKSLLWTYHKSVFA